MREVVEWRGLLCCERIFIMSAGGNGPSRSHGLAHLSKSRRASHRNSWRMGSNIGRGSPPVTSRQNATASMSNPFFDHPILNSPYEYPRRHWELDEAGQPTQKTVENRRSAKFVTPIPKPKKHKTAAQKGFVFDEGKGLSTKEQQYDPTSIINEVRSAVDTWSTFP